MFKKLFVILFIIFIYYSNINAQSNNIIYYTIFNKDADQYRWSKCSELLYNYSVLNKFNAGKIKNIINVLTSEEEKINSTLKDYWKNYWSSKSQESQALAQKEYDRNNLFRANQLIIDAKFAQKISDDINYNKLSNITVENILKGELKLQGNSMDIPREEVLQGFRKYYSADYKKFYEKLWQPKDENIPESYSLPPYLFNGYKVLGPSTDMIHNFAVSTSNYFELSINSIPLSYVINGLGLENFGAGYGISFKPSFNFSSGGPLYNKESLLLSHNAFKEILDLNERKDLEGHFYKTRLFWNIVTNFGFITYPSITGSNRFNNFFGSLGFGARYRYEDELLLTFNLYYLGLNYQTISSSITLTNGELFYYVSPEVEAEINLSDFTIIPSIQYLYQFKADRRISSINFGLGIKFIFGAESNLNF